MSKFQVGDLVVRRNVKTREIGADFVDIEICRITKTWEDEDINVAVILQSFTMVDGYPLLGQMLPHVKDEIGVFDDECELLFA